MSAGTGTFFSGERLAGAPVTFETIEGRTLRIATEQSIVDVPLEQIRVSDRLGNVARFIYLPDRAVIETMDNNAVDRWVCGSRRGRAASFIYALESHGGIAAAACAVVMLLIALGMYFGPPKLARAIAERVPPAIEERAGVVALASIDSYFRASTLSVRERARVEAQLTRVLGPRSSARPKLVFRSMPGAPNAFALPGGMIVVADQLVRLPATDDELAAMLAHEVGHLEGHHGLQTVLRNSFALLFVSGVTGDLSVLTSFAAALPLSILTNGYSRDLEREADAYALATLKARAIAPRTFSTLLFKLTESVTGPAGRRATTSYLSTHPAEEERMAMFGVLTDRERRALTAEVVAAEANDQAIQLEVAKLANDITANGGVDVQPVVLKRTTPVYPTEARKKGVTGTVVVDFVVRADGSVANAYVIKSADPYLDLAALDAVRSWHFIPGVKAGKPVPTHMQAPVAFTLNDAPDEDPAAPRMPTAEPAAPKPGVGGTGGPGAVPAVPPRH